MLYIGKAYNTVGKGPALWTEPYWVLSWLPPNKILYSTALNQVIYCVLHHTFPCHAAQLRSPLPALCRITLQLAECRALSKYRTKGSYYLDVLSPTPQPVHLANLPHAPLSAFPGSIQTFLLPSSRRVLHKTPLWQ